MRIRMTDEITTGFSSELQIEMIQLNNNEWNISESTNQQKGTDMAKIIKKNKLEFIGGYLTYKGSLITPRFVDQYLKLEETLQRARHDKDVNDQLSVPIYEKESIFEEGLITIPAPKTPYLDKAQKDADAIGHELKLENLRQAALDIIDAAFLVVDFVASKNVVIHDDQYHATIIDTPMLGNPLELTKEKLLKLVCDAAQYPLD